MASKKISNAKENTKKGTKELDNVKEVKNVSTDFKTICETEYTQSGNIKFRINGHTYFLRKTTGDDARYNMIYSDYVVVEMIYNNNTKEDSNNEEEAL